jgi:SP family general alpha glucoside:H+ symporter-like MFS transporter
MQKGKRDKARKALKWINGSPAGWDVDEAVAVIEYTVAEERAHHPATSRWGFEIFRGTNGWRLLIACWPKICQQFVGLAVFNTYATYVSAYPRYLLQSEV